MKALLRKIFSRNHKVENNNHNHKHHGHKHHHSHKHQHENDIIEDIELLEDLIEDYDPTDWNY